jgi:hypothetical protein
MSGSQVFIASEATRTALQGIALEDRRRSRCHLHPNRCALCGSIIKQLRFKYCRSCGTMPHLQDSRTSREDGVATVRRLFALRQRAERAAPI